MGEMFSYQVKKLANTIEQLNAENNLLKAENESLRQTIFIEKQRRKRGKPLFNTLCQDDDCKAVFYSPSKVQQARDELALREQEKQQADTQKANDKIQRQLAKEKKEEELKQRRVDREHARVQREKDTKAKAAKKEEDKLQRQAVQQLRNELKANKKKSKNNSKRSKKAKEVVIENVEVVAVKSVGNPVARPRRTPRLPQHLQGFEINIK
jgi:hypothetical protein